MRWWTIAVLLGVALSTSADVAVFPVDAQPPTFENWYVYYLRKQLRGKWSECDFEAAVLPGSLTYLACQNGPVCPSGRGASGVYGLIHPGPYYIEEPKAVLLTPERGWNEGHPRTILPPIGSETMSIVVP